MMAATVPYNEWWTKANRFYAAKEYDSAAFYYDKIAVTQPDDPEVYYNLGNAYYRLNHVAASILNYKRALRLQPDYKDAKDNLQLAQSRMNKKVVVSKDIFFIAWWKSLTSPSLAQFWAMAAFIVFLAFLLAQYLKHFKNSSIHLGIFYSVGLLFVFMMIAALVSANKRVVHEEAVVMQPDAVFKTDLKTGKPEMLSEGTIVKWKSIQGNNVSVVLPDGRDGWINAASLEKI